MPRLAPVPGLLRLPAELTTLVLRELTAHEAVELDDMRSALRAAVSLSNTCKQLNVAVSEKAQHIVLLYVCRRLFYRDSPLASQLSLEARSAHDDMVRSRSAALNKLVIEDSNEELERCCQMLIDSDLLWSKSLLTATNEKLMEIVRYVEACEKHDQ